MKEQLIRYIDLLFAGAPNAQEVKQEIMQNTLDRYDDLISQGKTPEAAYRLAITGIGDINEILDRVPEAPQAAASPRVPAAGKDGNGWRKLLRACAVALYILCPLPVLTLQNAEGVCALLVFVAVATALLIIAGRDRHSAAESPKSELKRSVGALVWAVGLVTYFVLSFATKAWYITWLVFLITPAVQGLVSAVIDLKEAA